MTSFSVDVSYSQIAVFNRDLENPFNDWSDEHVAQGFSWRDESVSFKTLIDAGPAVVEVVLAEGMPTRTGIRAISVPFTCSEGGQVEIASIADGRLTEIAIGNYQLLFETGFAGNQNWCRFTFLPGGSMVPVILISDDEITRTADLVMRAVPA